MRKRITAFFLCLMMVLTSVPVRTVAAGQTGTVNIRSLRAGSTASSATDTVYKIMLAIDKMGAATGGSFSNLGKEAELWLRFSGIGVSLAGFAGAGVAVLQMTGLIEDPTAKMLSQILSEIGNVQDQLQVINDKLDDIAGELIDLSADKKERDRQEDARDFLTKWTDFNSKYTEKMSDLMGKYEGYINQGARDWWAKDHTKEGDRYLRYTHLSEDNSVIPAYEESAEDIDKSLTVGIPAACMPETKNFRVSVYKDDFLKLYTPVIRKAADEGKIIVDASSSFYKDWAALNDKGKTEKAKAYAEDLFSTIMYEVACDVMTQENQFVIDVRNAYTNYCSNITAQNTGIDALINVLYVTHAFEKEIRDDVEKYCCGMVVQAGVYGEFALSCASQSELQTTRDIEQLTAKWTDTITKLYDKQSASLTGIDNYCYLPDHPQVLDFKEAKVQSTATVKWHFAWNGGLCYDKSSSTDWKLADKKGKDFTPAILKDDYAKVLYRYYLSQKRGDESFSEFLHKNGVDIPKQFSGKIVTNVKGSQIFSLSDGIEMTCLAMNTPNANFGNYFSDGKTYRINKGNPSKVNNTGFVVHDRALVNYLTLGGSLKTDQALAARALYAEHDSGWHDDEVHIFYKDATVFSDADQKDDTHTEVLTFSAPVYLLTLSPVVMAAFPGKREKTPLDLYIEKYRLQLGDEKTAALPSARTLTYNGKKQTGVKKGSLYNISGNTAKKAGSYTATLSLKDKKNYVWPDGTVTDKKIRWKIKKAANPLKIGSKTATVRYRKLKKKAQTLAVTKVIRFKKKLGDQKTYTLSSAKKGKKSFRKYFKINKKTGKVTIKKGLKKGTYKLKVKVRAAGNANYKASAVRNVTFRIRVK